MYNLCCKSAKAAKLFFREGVPEALAGLLEEMRETSDPSHYHPQVRRISNSITFGVKSGIISSPRRRDDDTPKLDSSFVLSPVLTVTVFHGTYDSSITLPSRGEKLIGDHQEFFCASQVEILCVAVLGSLIEDAALVPKLIERRVTPAIVQVKRGDFLIFSR